MNDEIDLIIKMLKQVKKCDNVLIYLKNISQNAVFNDEQMQRYYPNSEDRQRLLKHVKDTIDECIRLIEEVNDE